MVTMNDTKIKELIEKRHSMLRECEELEKEIRLLTLKVSLSKGKSR